MNERQENTYKLICAEIKRLRGPQSYVPLSLDNVTKPEDDGDRAAFRVNGARVFIENSGKLIANDEADGLPDCPRYADCLLRDFLPAVAADLLMKGNPHKPFLDLNSHTPESFESYLRTGIPLGKELPFPIAIVSRRMGNEPNGLTSFLLLMDLFEVVIRFVVLVQIADYVRRPEQTQDKVCADLRKLLAQPTLGPWKDQFCTLTQIQTENPFLVEIAAANIDRKVLDHFVELRNRIKGHGNTLQDAYYRLVFEDNIGKMETLLRTVSFLRNYYLVKPISITRTGITTPTGTDCEFLAWKLTGGNPSFDKRNLRAQEPLIAGRVYYLNQERKPLDLHPYVIVEPCQKCGREELLLFDGFSKESKRHIKYLGYESCPTIAITSNGVADTSTQHNSEYAYVEALPEGLLPKRSQKGQ